MQQFSENIQSPQNQMYPKKRFMKIGRKHSRIKVVFLKYTSFIHSVYQTLKIAEMMKSEAH